MTKGTTMLQKLGNRGDKRQRKPSNLSVQVASKVEPEWAGFEVPQRSQSNCLVRNPSGHGS